MGKSLANPVEFLYKNGKGSPTALDLLQELCAGAQKPYQIMYLGNTKQEWQTGRRLLNIFFKQQH